MQEVKKSGGIVDPSDPSDPGNAKPLIRLVSSLLIRYISKMKGYKRTTPLVSPPPLDVILTWLGAFLGITAIALFAQQYTLPVVASFGASAVLIYGAPPGGATALFAVLSKAHPSYILTPIAAGAVILVIVGLFVNNLSPNRQYPRYWY